MVRESNHLAGEPSEAVVKKVLVGVDGSDESQFAADRAAEIARAMGAELTVACVVAAPSLAPFESQEVVRRETVARLEARELLRRLSSRYLREGTKVDTVMPSGRPAETLADLAATPEVGLIVVGHRGRGGLARVLLGGIAERLAQISPKPVLVAR
jgi:nucleotide-binding universal stress UspA family protein